MDGTDHRLLAAAAWPAAAATAGLPTWQVVVGVAPAVAFSAGWTSPDVDDTWLMKKATKWIPGQWDHEIFGHRELLHWWGLPAGAAVLLWRLPGGLLAWLVWAALIGWSSHLAGDAIFGRPGRGTPIGIPIGPWFWHVGVGLRSGGWGERLLIWPICAALVWWALGHPGVPMS